MKKYIFFLVLLMLGSTINGQNSEFEIFGEYDAQIGRITLFCTYGCTWDKISFPLYKDGAVESFNHEGYLDWSKISEDDKNESDFLITVHNVGGVILFTGIKATIWKVLSFDTENQKLIKFNELKTLNLK